MRFDRFSDRLAHQPSGVVEGARCGRERRNFASAPHAAQSIASERVATNFARFKRAESAVERARAEGSPWHFEERCDRLEVGLEAEGWMGDDGLGLAGEGEFGPAAGNGDLAVEQRNDAQRIAGENELVAVDKPGGDGIHAAQCAQAVDAAQRKQSCQRFGVGAGVKDGALGGERAANFKVVVDLAVPREDHSRTCASAAKWLGSADGIEERESAVREGDMASVHASRGIGAAMGKQVAHGDACLFIERELAPARGGDSEYSAHSTVSEFDAFDQPIHHADVRADHRASAFGYRRSGWSCAGALGDSLQSAIDLRRRGCDCTVRR